MGCFCTNMLNWMPSMWLKTSFHLIFGFTRRQNGSSQGSWSDLVCHLYFSEQLVRVGKQFPLRSCGLVISSSCHH